MRTGPVPLKVSLPFARNTGPTFPAAGQANVKSVPFAKVTFPAAVTVDVLPPTQTCILVPVAPSAAMLRLPLSVTVPLVTDNVDSAPTNVRFFADKLPPATTTALLELTVDGDPLL